MEEARCPYCEHIVESEEPFCPQCKGDLKDIKRAEETQPKTEKKKTAKTVIIAGICLLLVVLITAGYFLWGYFGQAGVAALVNGEKIYWSEVERKLEPFKKMLAPGEKIDFDSPEARAHLNNLRNRILDSLIQEKILMAEVARGNWSVSAKEVEERISELKKERQIPDQAFEELLKNHGMTLEVFKQRLERELLIEKAATSGAKEAGITREQWLESILSLAKVEVFTPK